MSDRLESEIRSAVVELVEASPPPHPATQALQPLSTRSTGGLSSGPVRMAAVAAVVLVVGLAGAWVGRNLIPPETPDIPVVAGAPGPEPDFDPMGDEHALGDPGGKLQPEVEKSTLVGNVVAVGHLPQATDVEVFTWENTDGETCLQVVAAGFRDTHCSDEPAEGHDPSDLSARPDAFTTTRVNNSGATEVIAVWRVPEATSVVYMAVGEDLTWQRPVAGVSGRIFEPTTPRVIYEAWDAERESRGVTVFSPIEIVDPIEEGDTELEGAPEDLVEIGDDHPVIELLEGSGTIQEIGDALNADGEYDFHCSGGGIPPYAVCLIAAQDMVIVIPVEGSAGQTVRISDSGLAQDIVVPLDREEPVGVRGLEGPGVEAIIEHFGEETGSMSAPGMLSPPG